MPRKLHNYRNRLNIPRYKRNDDPTMKPVDWLLFTMLVVGGIWILGSAFYEVWTR